jgi:magnesium transporter
MAEVARRAGPDWASSWKTLLELSQDEDPTRLIAHLETLSESDLVHDFGRLSPHVRSEILEHLEPERAAAIVESLAPTHAAEAFEEITPEAAAEILEELSSDDQADLLGQLDAEDAEAILSEAPSSVATALRELMEHDPDSAGGRMVTEVVAVPATWTTAAVVAYMQENAERFADYVVQYVYVVGDQGELLGVLPLRDLLLAPGSSIVSSLMIGVPVLVPASAALEEVFEIFDTYAFLAVPVVDEAGSLIGALLREDVDEARVDRADQEVLKARGIIGGEELRSLPLHVRSGRRLAWLSINIVLNIVAASVIAFYEDTLQAVIALAVFLPIISDMSGCSGNQAVAVSLRELSLGVTRPTEIGRVLFKESSIGILNGLALGLLLGGLAWAWKGSFVLGAVVGSALAINTVVAVCIGGAVPLLIRRMGFDPALASGPMLTTATDLCGFFLVLSLATVALAQAML